jgi:HD superfamily phosphodiesterase
MIENLIFKASEKWGNPVLEFLSELYSEHWLPSHDISHHKRVWKNAFYFCKSTKTNIWKADTSFFEKLMLCCYFHDVGLLNDKSEFHGKESRKICERFLSMHISQIKFDTEELLFAIENHDEKRHYSKKKERNLLLEILTLADDLDAFGAIGVYRYIEIYLLRGIQSELISQKILINAQHRYDNVKTIMSGFGIKTDPFYNKFLILNKLLDDNNYKDDTLILVNWINDKIIQPKEDPIKFFRLSSQNQMETGRLSDFIDQFIFENEYF